MSRDSRHGKPEAGHARPAKAESPESADQCLSNLQQSTFGRLESVRGEVMPAQPGKHPTAGGTGTHIHTHASSHDRHADPELVEVAKLLRLMNERIDRLDSLMKNLRNLLTDERRRKANYFNWFVSALGSFAVICLVIAVSRLVMSYFS